MHIKKYLTAPLAMAIGAGGLVLSVGVPAASASSFSCPAPGSTVSGTLVVPAGQFCNLLGVTITGSLIAEPGSTVRGLFSTIDGSVVFNGTVRFSGLCGSTVKGSVTVENLSSGGANPAVNEGAVGLGADEAAQLLGFNCTGDQIGGSVAIVHNSGQVEVVGTTVSGPVLVSGNTGTGIDPTDGSVGIEGNTFRSSLVCFGNNPAPANDDPTTMPNTVQGQAVGQCAGLGTSVRTG